MASLTGSTTAVFFVRLSTAVDEIVDVDWNTRDGTAIAGKDYEAASGTVSFLPGETEKAIDVIVYGQDDVSADGKKFYIELKPPANAVLTDALAECVITVADEDGVLVTSLVIAQGKRGFKGNPGLSAYEQAVLMGYTGTVEQWMDEIGDASQAAERAESFASQAAERAVIAGQKADEAAEAVISTKQYVDGALASQSKYLDSELANQTQTVNGALSDLSTAANKFYPTLAAANADIANIQVNQPVTIGESANGGLWYKATAGATSLTKSAYDAVEHGKIYANNETELSLGVVRQTSSKTKTALDMIEVSSENTHPIVVDADDKVLLGYDTKTDEMQGIGLVGGKSVAKKGLETFVGLSSVHPIVVDADDKVLLGYDTKTDEMQGIGLVGGKSVAKKGLETFVGLSSVHPIVVDADDKVLLGYDTKTDEMQGIGLVGGKSVAKKGLETFVGLSSVHPIVVDADDKVLLGYDTKTDEMQGIGLVGGKSVAKKGLETFVGLSSVHPIVVDADDKVLLGYDTKTDEMQGIGLVGGKSVAKKGLETFVGLSSVHPIVVDADDKVLLGYDTKTDEMQGIGLVGGKSVAKKGLETFVGLSSVHPIVVDADDKVLLGYDQHTDRLIGSFQLDSLSYQNQKSVKFPYYLPHHALNQVISYGQSLSTGTKGQPVLSSTQNFANVTFSGGVLYWGNDATQLTTSKPLIEETLNDQGETICSGLANYASYLALTQNGVHPSDHVIFASSAGSQGLPILNLMKGSSTYTNRFLKHLTSARQVNQDIALNIVTWMQGETDSGALPALYPTLTKDDYKAKFLQLVSDVNNDAKALGQETPVIFLTYQHSSLVKASDAGTQRAMIEAMQENDKVYCIVPTYPFPHADVLHLTALGYKWIGAYFGRAYKQILHDKIKPLTLKPLSSIYSGNKVTVFFDVPFSPLKFDTKTLAETKNFGFSVKVNGIQAEISSVKVAQSGTSIEILLSSSIATSSIVEVRYAIDQSGVSSTILESGSGNLCDSCPETVSINGNVRPLFYVCPHFSLIAINGDI